MKISVRDLVEFMMRSGDIDNRHHTNEKDAMLAGGRIHRKLQKSQGADYKAEVTRRITVTLRQGRELTVEGRADGIFTEEDTVFIDEIKGVARNLASIEEAVPVHRAQAMCYAYITAVEEDLEKVGIRLTYCHLETEDVKYFREVFTQKEITQWFEELTNGYEKWIIYKEERDRRRTDSLKKLEFPFPYREGQRKLAVSVYRSIERKRNLFIQAATGIGKTMSVLFPALKAVGEGHGDRIFYLTAKTITRGVAEEAFDILRGQDLIFQYVTLTAKEKLCPMDEMKCNPEYCPYANGHYDRINDAVFDLLHRTESVKREDILSCARDHGVCPFELSLDAATWTDGVICDYNYVFDPTVKLKRFFGDEAGDYLFLVDEAHNLVDRAREMYSAVLLKEDILKVRRLVKDRNKRLAGQLDACNKIMLELKKESESCRIYDKIDHVLLALGRMYPVLQEYLEESPGEKEEEILDFFFEVRNFLEIGEKLGEHYQIYSEVLPDQTFMLKLFCVNPAPCLKECLKKGRSTVFFSATLLPVSYYKELLGEGQEEYAVYAPSPFPSENRLLCVAQDVTSRYTRRTEREYQRIWEYIRAVVKQKAGNYMVFLPSYQFLGKIASIAEQDKEYEILVQDGGMKEEEREAFLDNFLENREKSLIAFCVIGGIFSEGIDLKQERLIGAFIVGTGLPLVCTEREILKNYFDSKMDGKGFDYAYRYPGMNKVMQAAGRVIRTAGDEGVILLMDERFLYREYQDLFPLEWSGYTKVRIDQAERLVRSFWEEREEKGVRRYGTEGIYGADGGVDGDCKSQRKSAHASGDRGLSEGDESEPGAAGKCV